MITTVDIIDLLVKHVADISAADLVKECIDLGMRQIPYIDLGIDNTLPPFEQGYHFRFNPDSNEEVLFEILEKDGFVLQAGYQLVFTELPSSSKIDTRYQQIQQILETHYGVGVPMISPEVTIMNYGNDSTVAYISRSKLFTPESITVRVGSKTFWGN
jgi:hypothetical protein